MAVCGSLLYPRWCYMHVWCRFLPLMKHHLLHISDLFSSTLLKQSQMYIKWTWSHQSSKPPREEYMNRAVWSPPLWADYTSPTSAAHLASLNPSPVLLTLCNNCHLVAESASDDKLTRFFLPSINYPVSLGLALWWWSWWWVWHLTFYFDAHEMNFTHTNENWKLKIMSKLPFSI